MHIFINLKAMDLTILREFLPFLLLYFVTRFVVHRLLPTTSRRLPPGPRGYPIVGAIPLLGRAPHSALADLAKQYGEIMYLKMGSHGVVVASTTNAACHFLKTLDTVFSDRPIDSGPKLLSYGAHDLVFAKYGPKWKLQRKVCKLGLLGPQALEKWADVRKAEVGRMVQSMCDSSRRNEPIEIGGLLMFSMANMLGQVILGRRVLDDAKTKASMEFKEMVVELMTMAGLVNIGDYVPAVAWMDLQGLDKRMRRLHGRLDALWSRLVAEHEGVDRKGRYVDLLDTLVAYRDSGDGEERLTDVNIKALLNNLFTAGTDTSSSTIEWAIAELLLNPLILKRAQKEMDSVIGRDRRLEESDIPHLPYLKAICKEAFRKHPSTPLNLPRIATKDCEANGYNIPKGTRLIVNIWAIGRDPDVWPNPLDFDPGRFMTPEGSKIEPSGNHFELIPFGAGRRICAGARMGVTLVQYMIGTLVHAFDWEVPEGVEFNMDETFGLALQKAVPVSAIVRPRLAQSVYSI